MEYEIQVVELEPQPVLVVEAQVAPPELGEVLGKILPKVFQYIHEQGQEMAGMPFLRYLNMDDQFHIDAGIPTLKPVSGSDDILSKTLPGGRVATTLHLGSYETVGEAWNALFGWCSEQGIKQRMGGWDVYENDPTEVSPSEVRTRLHFPLG
jgi:effector-binding domain-containing protein